MASCDSNFQGRFTGQVAIVTGGADGIGLGVAKRLVTEDCRVALFDVNADKCLAAAGELQKLADEQRAACTSGAIDGDDSHTAMDRSPAATAAVVKSFTVDVTSEETVGDAVSAVVQLWGRLDIAVNCAGILGPNGVNIADVSIDGFDLVHRSKHIISIALIQQKGFQHTFFFFLLICSSCMTQYHSNDNIPPPRPSFQQEEKVLHLYF